MNILLSSVYFFHLYFSASSFPLFHLFFVYPVLLSLSFSFLSILASHPSSILSTVYFSCYIFVFCLFNFLFFLALRFLLVVFLSLLLRSALSFCFFHLHCSGFHVFIYLTFYFILCIPSSSMISPVHSFVRQI
jgi:hypothetical protein